jgi:hypothetical protein
MNEIMYELPSLAIVGVLFVSLLLSIELGYRFGLNRKDKSTDGLKSQVNAIQGALLGILALLLGFTFSLALQRYDRRAEAVVEEANAIGTAYLRAQMLPESVRGDVRAGLRQYVDLRVSASSVSLNQSSTREAIMVNAKRSLESLWKHSMTAAAENPNPVAVGLFIQALNEVIDSYGRRDAALNRHVPELVLFLLYGTFLMTGVIVGYASGIAGHRASFITYIMVTLIVCLVFIIIDLDRPRRGLIQIDQQSILSLQAEMALHK